MRRSGEETTPKPSFPTAPSRQNQHHLWLYFVSLVYCSSLYLRSGFNGICISAHTNSFSTGHNHRWAGSSHMRSAQSAKIATATIALFRQFHPISGLRPTVPTSHRLLASHTRQIAHKSFPLISNRSADREQFSVRRHLSTSGETQQKSSSFSVPAMGTDIDNDGSIAAANCTGYEKWVRRLYATNMFHPVKLGLENMHLLHKLLGNPMDDVSASSASNFLPFNCSIRGVILSSFSV